MDSPRAAPEAWSNAPLKTLSAIQGICLDIDDTLSSHGKLTPEAYAALASLSHAGFVVVPVTGRPAGWCDHIARFWPVDAVVGENGAFSFFVSEGKRGRIDTPCESPAQERRVRLEKLKQDVRARFPEARWASDQAYREFDLAIDICEDVSPWPDDRVQALIQFCVAEGAHAKLSSIHVNAWFGNYDKKAGLKHWLAQGAPGLARSVGSAGRKPPAWDRWIYIGDSPNDEPLFAGFELSVGVANLKKYLPKLASPPRWLTTAESGTGFAEFAERLVRARAATGGC